MSYEVEIAPAACKKTVCQSSIYAFLRLWMKDSDRLYDYPECDV
ncbi:hypothetical protein [Nostoc sp. C117]